MATHTGTLRKATAAAAKVPALPRLRVGVAGLGVAAGQILPAFGERSFFSLVAGADNRKAARDAFTKTYGREAVGSVEQLCRRDDIDTIWISTPNTLHAEHAVCAAKHGKHVICEKPMAVTLRECDRMIRAADDNGVHLLQGHSKIYQNPMKMIREIVKSGRLGRVIQIQTANFNDWLQRPRLAPEIDTARGGGIVYRQGPHMVDIVRYIGGGMVRSLRGIAGRADPHFDTEGHFSALLEFEDGAAATLAFNGYGYFDVTEMTWDIGESGFPQSGRRRFPNGPRIKGPADPAVKSAVAEARKPRGHAEKRRQPFFGLTVVACEFGVIRQSPDGLYVYTEAGREEVPCASSRGRDAELVELADAIERGRPAFPDGRWGKATLEVCLGILASSADGRLRRMRHQVPAP
jgi:phthalate 4,5-cis-dihydrodiol dehydrogenase